MAAVSLARASLQLVPACISYELVCATSPPVFGFLCLRFGIWYLSSSHTADRLSTGADWRVLAQANTKKEITPWDIPVICAPHSLNILKCKSRSTDYSSPQKGHNSLLYDDEASPDA